MKVMQLSCVWEKTKVYRLMMALTAVLDGTLPAGEGSAISVTF
jgi:hypothetical protein